MQVKAKDLRDMSDTIESIFSTKIDTEIAVRITRLVRLGREALQATSLEIQETMRKYAKKDEHGNAIIDTSTGNIEIQEQYITVLDRELTELWNKVIEIEGEPLTLDDIKGLDLTVGQINALIPFVAK